jgi:hypothetical protein
VEGILDVPDSMAAKLIRASGTVRGVFARPFMAGRDGEPARVPEGMAGPLEVTWFRTSRPSEAVAAALAQAGVAHEGLVCGRQKGAMGIRLGPGQTLAEAAAALLPLGIELSRAETRVHLRARGVPTMLAWEPQAVLDALNPGLSLLECRTIGGSRYAVDMEVWVTGVLPEGQEWEITSLGQPFQVHRVSSGWARGRKAAGADQGARDTGRGGRAGGPGQGQGGQARAGGRTAEMPPPPARLVTAPPCL